MTKTLVGPGLSNVEAGDKKKLKLEFLFNPKSIAVIGASSDKSKLGHMVLSNIKNHDYKGKIFPVNLHDKKILGLTCYENILEIREDIDLAVFVIPAALVPFAMKQCGKKGVKGAIIISAGFREIGSKGLNLEEDVIDIAKHYGIRVLGPNCLGLINTQNGLNASFAESMPNKWDISVFSQSGAMCTAILDWANANGIGFSKFVSLGNKSDVNELDLLEAWEKDDTSDVILGYLEGIEDGERFLKITKKITKKKPLIIIKAGSSDEGARAISSHTGSLAGYDQAAETAFSQAGIVRAKSIQDLFDFCSIFSFSKIPKGNKVTIITNAGGPGVMATDAIDASEVLEMTNLAKKTGRNLSKCLPQTSNVKNPIDVVGDAKADRYECALFEAVQDKETDMILVLLTPQVTTEVEKTAQLIAKYKKSSDKVIVASFVGGNAVFEGTRILEKAKVPVYSYPERAVKSLEALYRYSRYLKKSESRSKKPIFNFEKVERLTENAKGLLNESATSQILEAYGIPVIDPVLCKNKREALRAGRRIGFPVVLKISSPEIVHKTDMGGVVLNIKDSRELKKAYANILENVKKHDPDKQISGITVSKMIDEGQEVIVGGKRDDVFGPMIMFGLGGLYVEVLKDVVFRLCPVSKEEALKMVTSIKTSGLLTGFRGQWACDTDAIADVIVRVSHLMADIPAIREIDVNPLRVHKKGDGAIALDTKIVL